MRQIADTFLASLSCAAIRYAELSDEPVAAIVSYNGTIEWVSFSAPLQEHRFSRAPLRGEWAPPRSATRRLAANVESIIECETKQADGVLTEWFADAPPTEMVEEALGLGAYGRVLTVLYAPDLPSEEQVRAREERESRGPTSWTAGLREWNWDSLRRRTKTEQALRASST